MKPILPVAMFAALVALGSTVSAQMYGSSRYEPGDYPGNASVGGPQWRHMMQSGSTTNDKMPYGGNDAYSDRLSESRTVITVQPPPPQWEPR